MPRHASARLGLVVAYAAAFGGCAHAVVTRDADGLQLLTEDFHCVEHVAVHLEVNPKRHRSAAALHGTGDDARDTAVRSVLAGTSITRELDAHRLEFRDARRIVRRDRSRRIRRTGLVGNRFGCVGAGERERP
ncbi:hypothetical protein D3C71_1711470 [compost metagenome]